MADKNIQLVIIDPQHDFCDPSGALFVAGADQDMSRTAKFIKKHSRLLADINVTLDSHHPVDVAHPVFWRDTSGKNPDPFTIITADDVEQGGWTPTKLSLTKRMIAYVKALEANGRYPLCIWPPHCLIGSMGQTIVPEVQEALNDWANERFGRVDFVTKGSNNFTEHYSAVKAEVVDPQDPSTQLNTRFIEKLEKADQIIVAGEAGSHCLANTVRDIADNFADQDAIKKIVLLTDATSPVVGAIDFTGIQETFITEMADRGMQVTTTTDY